MKEGKVVSLEDRVPQLKKKRRKKANRRLIIFLCLFFLLVLAIIYFQSPLSHVKFIHITGNQVYPDAEIISKSGITKGINIWNIDKQTAEKKIEQLPEVRNAKISVRFPNTVHIHVDEWSRIAYLLKDDRFIPLLENGEILAAERERSSMNAPVLVGFSAKETIYKMAEELAKLPEEVYNSISEIHYAPKETDKYHVHLYMNNGFEVSASLGSFAEKMAYYPSMISHLDPEVKGLIDIEVGGFFQAFDEGMQEMSDNDEER